MSISRLAVLSCALLGLTACGTSVQEGPTTTSSSAPAPDSALDVFVLLKKEQITADPDCRQSPCTEIRESLSKIEGTSYLTYVTSEQATKEFVENPRNKDFGDLTAGMTLSPQFRVRVNSQDVYDKVYEQFNGAPGVEQVGYDRVK